MLAPRDPEPVADLADGRVDADRLEDRWHEVVVGPRGGLQPIHRGGPGVGRSFGTDPPNPLDLAALPVGVDPLERWRMDRVVTEPVHADDDLVAVLDRPLDAIGRLLDLALLEPALDGGERSAHRLDLVEVGPRRRLELVRQALDVVGAGERVGRLGDAGLVGDDLLGPEGEAGGVLGRQREGLVP